MYLGKIVELSDTDQLFTHMLHPYTEALLSAIPVVDVESKTKRIILDGDVPSPVNPPTGCHFHPRCKKCLEKCKSEEPKLRKYVIEGKEHFVACHLMDEKEENNG